MYLKDKKAEILSGFVTVFENVPDYLIKEICQWDRYNPISFNVNIETSVYSLKVALESQFEMIDISIHDDLLYIKLKPKTITKTTKINICNDCKFCVNAEENNHDFCNYHFEDVPKNATKKPDFCKLTEITTVEENY